TPRATLAGRRPLSSLGLRSEVTLVVVVCVVPLLLDVVKDGADDTVRAEFREATLYQIVGSDAGGNDEKDSVGQTGDKLGIRQETDRRRVQEDPVHERRDIGDHGTDVFRGQHRE